MSDEKIHVPIGTKVRIDGESFQLEEPIDVAASMVEPKEKQANRHKAFGCREGECVVKQCEVSRGNKPFTFRSSSVKQLEAKWALPKCGMCDSQMTWLEDGDEDNLPTGALLSQTAQADNVAVEEVG